MTNEQRIEKLREAIDLLERVDGLQQEALDPDECRDFFDQIQGIIEEFEDKIQQLEGMISASNLAYLSDVPLAHLNAMALASDNHHCKLISATFKGLNKNGKFCYDATFVGDDGIVRNGKVFLTHDFDKNITTLDF
jgi:hypothetical protein